MRYSFVIATCVALFFATANASAKETFHRWVDEQGVTHYSKTKPANQDSVVVQADSKTTISGGEPGAPETSAAGQHSGANNSGGETNAESTIAQWCAHHRETLEILTNNSRVHQTDPQTGEKVILSEPERARLIEETKQQLQDCPP